MCLNGFYEQLCKVYNLAYRTMIMKKIKNLFIIFACPRRKKNVWGGGLLSGRGGGVCLRFYSKCSKLGVCVQLGIRTKK